jgi:pyruvate dehydrogenase E2 component (dihydrolipoamide acetyltransferase)
MPKLGLTMTNGKVVKWLAQDGGRVEEGQPLVVVMTKKITYEIACPASGVLHVVAHPKEARPVGEALGFILQPGESPPSPSEGEGRGEGVPPSPAAGEGRGEGIPSPAAGEGQGEGPPREVRSSPAARRLARELGVEIAQVQGTGSGGRITEKDVQTFHDSRARVAATPLARRMADEEGLDLTEVQGTGPGGRITEDDVLRVLEGRAAPAVARPGAVPFAGMRQAIAEGMMESLHSMAQLTLTTQADVTGLVELRDVLRQRWEARISYTDLIVKAAAVALREHPILNSMLLDEEIVLHGEVNVGVAVALDEGLIVPVVREADRKTVLEIHAELEELARRAREGTLSVDQVTGGTFTVTNLGMYGVDAFTPIINPPQVAILGVGRITEGLALQGGQVVSRSKTALSLTIDHRIVDGAPGAAFLQTLVQLLEHPALIFAGGPVGMPD